MGSSGNFTTGGEHWELEPDLEHDPTLASCCARELRQNKENRLKMDTIRAAMPAALVNKNWISPEELPLPRGYQAYHEAGCGCCSSDAERMQKNQAIRSWRADDDMDGDDERGGSEGDEEDDIDKLLGEVDDDLEVVKIREARMQQLKAMAEASKNRPPKLTKPGELNEVPANVLVGLMHTEKHLVALLCPSGGANKRGGEDEDEATDVVLAGHLRTYAPECRGTVFVAVTCAGQEGGELQHMVRCDALPAIVCFRDGVIVARSCGYMRQFVQMGEVGQAVFRAWLWQAKVLKEKEEDERMQLKVANDSDDDAKQPRIEGVSPNKSKGATVRAVFQSRGDLAGTCTEPNCKHTYKHEHVRTRPRKREVDSEEELLD